MALRKGLIRIQVGIPVDTVNEMEKVAKESGLKFNEIVRFTLNSRFNPAWIQDEERFNKRLDESLGKKTSRKRSNGKP
jgi:hypothetical protein